MRLVPILVPLFVLACGSSSDLQNPTGSCEATGKGNRAGYDAEPVDATWLPDCKSPVAREYWRVFAKSSESAYMLPRPDGEADLVAACANPAHPLHALVQSYPLCSAATSETVARINSMLPADALQIAHYLHTVFAFVNDSGAGTHITPFPIPGDILDACSLYQDTNSADLATICTREQDRLHSGILIGFTYDGLGAVELVARLNELYGISCSAGLSPITVCTCAPSGGGCADLKRVCRPRCQTDSDCVDSALPVCMNGYCDGPCE
jgi:hypothetical protein